MTDKRIVRISSASVFAVLLLAFILPLGESGRIVAAILLLPAAVIIPFLIKKRNILSINKNQVLLIITVIAMLYVMLCYLTIFKFGFYQNPYRFNLSNFFKFFLPIAAIITFSEVIRYVLMAQNDKLASVLCYLSCVVADMLICSNLPSVTSMAKFMDLVAGAFFPAIISNLLYNYLSKRYGIYPNLVFRAITVLYVYTFSILPAISDAILGFVNIISPIAIYLFIDALYEKGVINGVDGENFNPEGIVTKEQFVKIIAGTFDIKSSGETKSFSDVPAGQWYTEFINAAVENGIVNGVSDTDFGLGTNISRQDMAVIVYRVATKFGITLPEVRSDKPADIDGVADYAKDAVAALYQAGIINGVGDGKFAPSDIATRAQAAKIIYELWRMM